MKINKNTIYECEISRDEFIFLSILIKAALNDAEIMVKVFGGDANDAKTSLKYVLGQMEKVG